ncbi:MAG: DUF1501 domain-containing protein [Pirellulales bacterium]|nr:DUF1501 domain-containing protein [Pirellulales bacterium]
MAGGLGVVGVGSLLPNYLVRTAVAGPAAEVGQRVLVVIQLGGGHDAISAVVPYGHEDYAKARNATRIKDEEVIKLNNELGLHPNLAGLKQMYDEGKLAVLPGVGYPDPNLSHFHSTDIWHTADMRGRQCEFGKGPYGWIGKTCDAAFAGNADPQLALAVGTGSTPIVIQGKDHPGLAFDVPESFGYHGDRGDAARREVYAKLNEAAREKPPTLTEQHFVTNIAVAANATSQQVSRLAAEYKPAVEYPGTTLGRNLRTIAGLIAGGLSTRIYFTYHDGGFDTHVKQRPHHDNLMRMLNDAVVAFYKDLAAHQQEQRVLAFTTSEFGRTVKENGGEGTDHGAAAAMFMFGPVKTGIHGAHPSLKDVFGGGGDWLKPTTDFRSVYATAIEKWLGVPSEPVLGKYPLIDCIA